MITIQSFKEMAKLHQSDQMPFRIMQEITAVLLGLCDYPKDIPEPLDITQQEVDWLLALPEDTEFMTYLGGWVYLVETEEDLAEVTGMDFEFAESHGGRWPNVTEAVLAWDDCRYLLNADGTADYALLFAAVSDAGGNSWFISRKHFQTAQINEQIQAHRQFWSVAK